MKLELLKVRIEKEKLLKIPSMERAFFLKAMNFLTDISILQKSCWHSIPQKDYLESLKNDAALIQAMFFIRHLAGLIWEGHKLIKTGFLSNGLGRSYQIKELKSIKKYFSRSDNLIQKIRNKCAYHLDAVLVGNELEKIPDSQELVVYFSMEMGNSLYKAGDDVLILAIARMVNKRPRAILDEILLMATTFQTFFSEFVILFHQKHLGFEPKDKITLDVPERSEVNIPYFVPRV